MYSSTPASNRILASSFLYTSAGSSSPALLDASCLLMRRASANLGGSGIHIVSRSFSSGDLYRLALQYAALYY